MTDDFSGSRAVNITIHLLIFLKKLFIFLPLVFYFSVITKDKALKSFVHCHNRVETVLSKYQSLNTLSNYV